MIKYLFALFFACSWIAQPATAETNWSDTDIAGLLEQVDHYRMPLNEGRVFVELTMVNNGERSRALPMRVEFSHTRSRRVETLGGPRKGQRVLLTQDAYWLYMPGIKQPVQLNRLQRILGQASFGDIGKLQFAKDYRAVEWKTEGELLKISLTARTPGQVVDDIELWISPQTGAPIRAALLFPSGKTFKILEFSDLSTTPFGPMIQRTRFIDPVNQSGFTELAYAIPEQATYTTDYFTPNALLVEKE